MTHRPRTRLCPKCKGVGLEEVYLGCRPCRVCYGRGRVIGKSEDKVIPHPIKTQQRSSDEGQRGA